MPEAAVSTRIADVQRAMSPFLNFNSASAWARRDPLNPATCDFVFGNPHEAALPSFVAALERWALPQNKDWFAYKMSEPDARKVVVEALRESRGLAFEEEDIFLTNGAFAALSVALCALVDPGDEVIFISPPWFFYESIIVAYGARPVRVKINTTTFDLDLDAIAAAITERTRAIIINSPHNPTGKIYPPETLEALAQLLTEASDRNDRSLYLLSDEAYSRILFDKRTYPSPTAYYPNTLMLYTYGKTLLTPGQRIGYIALPPAMPERQSLRPALFAAQLVTGYAFPNALLQHALSDLEPLSIDLVHLERKRDRLVTALREMGYELHPPEGTFYLLVRSPWPDDLTFADLLAKHGIFCLPGTVFELPGYFRLSLTANDEMIDRATPGFSEALAQARTHDPQAAPTS